MNQIPIIALFVLAILLTAVYFILRVHFKTSVIAGEPDFISTILFKTEDHLKKAGVNLQIKHYFLIMVIAPVIIGTLIFLGTKSGLFSFIVSLMGFFLPELIVQYVKMDHRKKFEERYARSLEQLSASLRAGMSIAQAVEDTANCKFIHESLRQKYAKMSSDLQMGLTVNEAFKRFAEGTHNEDAQDIALAINIQNEVGGHEADVIREIADSIHSRIMLRREIKSLFSSTSSMVWIMDVLIPLVFIGFAVLYPSFITTCMSNSLYTAVIIFFIVMVIIGSIINHYSLAKVRKGA